MIAYRSTQVRTLLLYAQDSRGLGHITRTLAITRHVLDAYPDLVGYICTRSDFAHTYTLPPRCDYVKLPSRQTPKHIERPPDDDEISKAHFRTLRGTILKDAALGLAPDLVLVDHEPLGTNGEFKAGLWALKQESPHTKFVFGLRDIMDDPDRIRAEWRELGVYEALEHLYDGIAVYGSPHLFDPADAYDMSESVRRKLHYCGYVVRDPPGADAAAMRRQYGFPEQGPVVLATVGSGYDGYPVLDAALSALERMKAKRPALHAILVTGPFMPPDEQASLQARANGFCRVVTTADTFQLMSDVDAIVSMGGYNSVCEGLAVGRPLVIVPRATHKVEQKIRAELLVGQGLAKCVLPQALTADSVEDALDWALARDRTEHAQRVREVVPAFDGAVRLTAYLTRWLGQPQPASPLADADAVQAVA
jgi:predicted glycosyltransferase